MTLQRIDTVATSRDAPNVKVLAPTDETVLRPVVRTLRLNSTNQHVAAVQQALAYLGQKIDVKEFKTATFGATTRAGGDRLPAQ